MNIGEMIPIKERLLQPNISKYFMDKYNLQPGDVIELVNDFYKKKQQIQQQSWYQQNKIRIYALQRSKYHNDPVFREYYKKHQALYQRGDYESRRGRPRIY